MFVTRDSNGKINGLFAVQQFPGQEFVAANAPELLLLQAKTAKGASIDGRGLYPRRELCEYATDQRPAGELERQ
jgi:hypothetical protein